MDIKDLVGKWAMRSGENCNGDKSYTATPVYILNVTDYHIAYYTDDIGDENDPSFFLREDWDDGKWVNYKDCIRKEYINAFTCDHEKKNKKDKKELEGWDSFKETKHFDRVNNWADGVLFEDSFYHFGGKDIDKETINSWIRQLKDAEEDLGYRKCGNTIVIKLYDKIIVAKNYWEND